MYEVSYNTKSLIKTYFLNLTHISKTVQTYLDRSHQTYLWAHFNLTVEAVCTRNKGTKTIDQAHHITAPKLSQPFLWSFSWKNDFVLRMTRAFWDIKRCVQWRDGLFFQTTKLWIIPRRLKLWSSVQGRLEKNTSYEKILEKRWALIFKSK